MRLLFTIPALFTLIALVPLSAKSDGLARSDNFIVLAPDKTVADSILADAERLRKDLAIQWLGHELPTGIGRTLIMFEYSTSECQGRFWPIDSFDRELHHLWLTSPRNKPFANMLAHETTHLILHIEFNGELPIWANEGVAMHQNANDFKRIKSKYFSQYASTGIWPDLNSILTTRQITHSDSESYLVAASLTSYLLEQGDPAKFFRFSMKGQNVGYDQALQEEYGTTLSQLQKSWKIWARTNDGGSAMPLNSLHRENKTSR